MSLAATFGLSRAAIPQAATATAGSSVRFDRVSVAYKGHVVLEGLTLDVPAGEILALIGPSGSGKTTALRAVAGFVRPASGRISIGGVDVTDLPPYARGLAMVVQTYALFPHMRVADNVAFGLQARRAPRGVVAERVAESLRIVGMSSFSARYPRELSGGQQQRVAIARALAVRPRVLLLDEPLSALDAQIRRSMVEEIARLHRDLPDLTVLYVTHDQGEALTLADRIAIMRDGALCAEGPTADLYRRPPNRFAAEFLGRANILPVVVEAPPGDDGLARVRRGGQQIRASAGATRRGEQKLLCLRPQALSLVPGPDTPDCLTGTFRGASWQGEVTHVTVEVDGVAVNASATRLPPLPPVGGPIDLWYSPSDATLIVPDAGV